MTPYWELVRHALDSGSAPGFGRVRERLAATALSTRQSALLAALDQEALEDIVELPDLDDDLLQDDSTQPLEKWWWHLGKIRRGEYPAALLPESLRAIYSDLAR